MVEQNLYAPIDPIVEKWVEENSLKLFRAFAERAARFVYITSSRGECFQISIQPPQDGEAKVDAWTIETLDDREMHEEWVMPVTALYEALQNALITVRRW